MAPLNRSGAPLLRDLASPQPLDPVEVERALRQRLPLIDARPRLAFADGHIPGSLNIELSDEFGTYLGWLVPWNEPVVFVLPDPESQSLRESLAQARQIGFDRVMGYAAGGIEAWSSGGGQIASYPTATLDDLLAATPAGTSARSWTCASPPNGRMGRCRGAGRSSSASSPRGSTRFRPGSRRRVICRTGHRAAMAASLLDRAGMDARLVTPGGVPDLLQGLRSGRND